MDPMRDDFYEDDEPVAEIVAAFEAGQKIRTGRSDHLPTGAVLGTPPQTFGLGTGGTAVPPYTPVRISVGAPASVS